MRQMLYFLENKISLQSDSLRRCYVVSLTTSNFAFDFLCLVSYILRIIEQSPIIQLPC